MPFRILVILMFLTVSVNATAAWFEATGQAVIYNGNTSLARQQATEEAIRQALLFSGASIRSVQQIRDGLLEDENLEVRAFGEVSKVELVSEHYHDDYVEVTIRADVFSPENRCRASDYKKSLVTSHFHVAAIRQSLYGDLYKVSAPISRQLANLFSSHARHSAIAKVLPYSFFPRQQEMGQQAMLLAEREQSNYILLAEIVELAVQQANPGTLEKISFWRDTPNQRKIAIRFILIDGAKGHAIMDKTYRAASVWPFEDNEHIDPNSDKLWNSAFGNTIKGLLKQAVLEIDEKIMCEPAYGRIIEIYDNKILMNMGSIHGVKRGDTLSVFQMRQLFSPAGIPQLHYQIHPSTATVAETFHDSAVLQVMDGTPLANIQPNDFVVRR